MKNWKKSIRNYSVLHSYEYSFKVGVDSCTIPGLLNFGTNLNLNCMDACEGARYSAYISADMRMVPCSFEQSQNYSVSLKENTIEEAWNSKEFEAFRNKQRNACPNCEKKVAVFGRMSVEKRNCVV